MSAELYVVATPIGNLDDITLRALKVLSAVDLVLAEDTRRTRKLLSHFEIRKPLQSLHEHNEDAQATALVARLLAGESMALVSDAGTPLVSDPGFPLLRAAIAAGVTVVPVPGPSAVLAALTASGLPTDRFLFIGYLPRKKAARRRVLEDLAAEPGTVVFLESPRRLGSALGDAAEILGPRPAAVARELTKVHEEVVRGTLPEVASRFAGGPARGEVTVCIGGSGSMVTAETVATAAGGRAAPGAAAALDRDELARRYQALLSGGMSRNDALKQLAADNDVPRREIYRVLMRKSKEPR
jgi:16S rRNA (cytidine1402-2'-O)-methyltransferase